MKRNQRLASRQSQPPLTPRSYTDSVIHPPAIPKDIERHLEGLCPGCQGKQAGEIVRLRQELRWAERDLIAERHANAQIIRDLRKQFEYQAQGELLNALHPQCETQPTPEENPIESENPCQTTTNQ